MQASSAYARNLIEASLDPLVTVSADGKIMDVNAATETITGVSRDKLIGSDFVDYFTDPERAREAYQQAFARNFVTEYPLAIRHVSGKTSDVLYNASVYRDANGQVLGVFAAARDITQRKQAEFELRQSKERLEAAASAGIVGIWDWDVPNNVLVWDDVMYRLYGIRAEDFGGAYEAWASAIHPDDRARTEGEIQAALRGEREYAPEFRVVWPDASVHRIKAASHTTFDEQGRPLRMIGVNYDLTEQKKIEEALHREGEKNATTTRLLDSIVENIPNMIFLKRAADLQFVLFNKAGEKLLGLDRADLLGKNDYDFFPREQADFFTAKDREVLNSTAVVDVPEETIDTRHGPRILHTKKLALRDSQGEPEYLLGISEDITEIRRTAEELDLHRHHLEQLIELRTQELAQAKPLQKLQMSPRVPFSPT